MSGPEHAADVDRREIDRNRFKIDTTVNIAHIITTVVLMVSIVSWGADMKAMVQRHDSEIQDVKGALKDDRAILRDELREINRKIDKIVQQGRDK